MQYAALEVGAAAILGADAVRGCALAAGDGFQVRIIDAGG